MKRRLAIGAVVCSCACPAPALAAGGLRLVGMQRLGARLEQLTFETPAVKGTTDVRLLLPAGYASHARRRYPVLYLLHGAIDNYASWTVKGDAEQLTARYPVIVVMPDTGPSGGYTNWFNGGAGGPPEWETYHIDQLIPWIDGHLRTRAVRAERAIAGLSMGGFGAMSYAARHPDLFAAVASFSGAVDTNNPLDIAVTPSAVWGLRTPEQILAGPAVIRWRAHNPWDLAANLRGVNLTIRTGNGLSGGPYGPSTGMDIVEYAVHQMSVSLYDRLTQLGIPSIWDDYGPGGHLWPYWQRDLRQTLPTLMRTFAHPRPSPSSFTFKAAEPRYGVYGWSVVVRRRVMEFSTLQVGGRRGFSVTGSGRATVTTAAEWRPGQTVLIVIRDARGWRTRRIAVARNRRLVVQLSLGPSNRYQEYTTKAAADRFLTARVAIRAAR